MISSEARYKFAVTIDIRLEQFGLSLGSKGIIINNNNDGISTALNLVRQVKNAQMVKHNAFLIRQNETE